MNIKQGIEQAKRSLYVVRAKNTARAFGNGLNAFEVYLVENGKHLPAPLEKLTMEDFIFFPAWLAKHSYSKSTSGVYLAGAKYFLDQLVIGGIIKPDYAEILRYQSAAKQLYKKREKLLPRTPQRDAVKKIMDAVRELDEPSPRLERDIALIEFLASTGCRNDEAVQLKIKNIDMTERSAKVIGKGSKERIIYFSKEAAEAMRRYWVIRGFMNGENYAFARHDRGAGKKHKMLTTATVRNIVNQVVLAAGLERGSFTPHYFRHAFAILMLRKTHNLALVQDLMGHGNPAATRIYAKIYPDELRDAHREVFGD